MEMCNYISINTCSLGIKKTFFVKMLCFWMKKKSLKLIFVKKFSILLKGCSMD